MQLVEFTVKDYRSIGSAERLPISQYTVLIGPNNEGKSNLLNAISAAMSLIEANARRYPIDSVINRHRFRDIYDWDRDFPISKQLTKPKGRSTFRLAFQLTPSEIDDFKQSIGSSLNGTLPIEIKIGRDHEPDIKVIKRGRGGPALTKKSSEIAEFIGKRIEFNYIPAIRASDATEEVVSRMVSRRLRSLESNSQYRQARQKLRELQEPLLEQLSAELLVTLSQFLPDVSGVQITAHTHKTRLGVHRTPCDIVIDDGTPTLLERKGDGIKSLAAISLLYRSAADESATVVALEEPESHLHPKAIHRLREVLAELSQKSQVVITTHNPLFVDRLHLGSNILVSDSLAEPAKELSQIRDLLGVRASDNLRHARLILVVEGETDRDLLQAVFSDRSAALRQFLNDGQFAIDHLGGGSNLSYKLSELQNSLCTTHVLMDADETGRSAIDKAIDAKLTTDADCNLTKCKGMKDAELEDPVDWSVYAAALSGDFGVTLNKKNMRPNKRKWSVKMRDLFDEQGKHWNNSVLARLKRAVVNGAVSSIDSAIVDSRAPFVNILIASLETKLESID